VLLATFVGLSLLFPDFFQLLFEDASWKQTNKIEELERVLIFLL
jgi:hypothetical protein